VLTVIVTITWKSIIYAVLTVIVTIMRRSIGSANSYCDKNGEVSMQC
jgi:type IV secretory pathway VirB3-like protein